MTVLVDSSVWINYFRGKGAYLDTLDFLISENLVVINDLILAELQPPLMLQKEHTLVTLLFEIKCQPLRIQWPQIIDTQLKLLKSGVNGISIADLIIAQNAIQGYHRILSVDKHFRHISKKTDLKLYT